MSRLSVVILARDEAHHLPACLASVAWADQRLVVDTGSTDDTVAVATANGARVEHLPHWEGFGAARRSAERLADGPWIFMLDADERVSPELAAAIRDEVARDDRTRVSRVVRRTWCFGRWIRHGGWSSDWVARLYAPASAQWTDARVHERLEASGDARLVTLTGPLLHYTYDSMRDYLEKSARYAETWAMEREAEGRRGSLLRGLLSGGFAFLRMYLLRLGILDGRAGFLLALLSAHSTFVRYADLWVRQRPGPPASG